MKRRDFFWKSGLGLAGLATAGCAESKLNIFIPKQSLDDYLERYTPIVEDLASNKQEPSQFLYSSMFSDAQGVSIDYNRNEGSKVKYEGPRLASETEKGDIDGNGKVNIFDLLELLKMLGNKIPATSAADIDGNGKVNIFDLIDLLNRMQENYGKSIFNGTLTDLFSNELIPEADIEILDASGNPVSTQKAKNGSYNVRLASSADYFRLRFSADNFFTHISSALCADKSRTMNLGLVPEDFNMNLFDTVVRSGDNQPDATTRWMAVPNFYIVNGPINGYTGFETPNPGYIDELVNIINNDLKQFTNNFINNPLIKIGNNPVGEGAGKEIYIGYYGNVAIPNEGWVTISYNSDPNMGFTGERGPIVNLSTYNMEGAHVRINVNGINDSLTNRKIGMHELTGVMGDIKNTNEVISVLNAPALNSNSYTDFDLKLGKFLYSRPAGNRTKDINP